MAHELPALPYAFDALEPHIDAQTMQIHHGKHHQAYVNNLNAALEKFPELQGKPVEELIKDLTRCPRRSGPPCATTAAATPTTRCSGRSWGPNGGGAPTGAIGDAITSTFGSFDSFKEQINKAGVGRFGSGWAWLVDTGGKLAIESTANQDSPIMEGKKPILGIDVWEHAYYLKYQNRRPDYLAAWWNVVNWDAVNARLGK